jgi:predicted transposase/invertase (TIGR01784 family)
MITEQLGSGNDYDKINKVISIIIMNENLIANSLDYHHCFTFYDPKHAVELTDLVEIHTLELQKLPQNADGTALYDWASFIDAENEEELTRLEERNPEVKKAVITYYELTAEERVRDTAFRQQMYQWDQAAQRRKARKEGVLDVARKMLNLRLPLEAIVECTGLAKEEVESLQQ